MYQNFQVIERAYTENGEIQLQKRGYDFEIIFNGTFLMATYNGESEKLLVRWAIKEAYSPKRVLIGGLGVGFSLAEALNHKTIEKITVVEIESKIIEWNRLYFSTYSNYALNDPRVDVINAIAPHQFFTLRIHSITLSIDIFCIIYIHYVVRQHIIISQRVANLT